MIISLGGDGTFLKTANYILDNQMPLLGINTDPKRSVGCLCPTAVRDPLIDSKAIIHQLMETRSYRILNRTRISTAINGLDKPYHISLNEAFLGEKERG